MTSASPSSSARARLSISNNKAMESLPGPACQTPYLKADGTRQKRQEPAAPRPRAHNALGQSKLASPGSRLSRKGGRGCCRPVGSTLGRGHQGCGQMAPRGLPAPSPAQAKHAPVAGGRWVVCGRLLELSSPGWARLGLWSTGVWVAAASARMRRGWSSLKCGSLLSLTPASLPRRAVARKLFLCLTRSHALPSPSFSCSALLGRAHPQCLGPGSSSLL